MKKIAALLFFLSAFCAPACAATLISTASGNIDATGTWNVVDTTGTNAFLNSETANTALTTTPVASSTFTPAAETTVAIGVKLASVAASPSGTMTIKLANSISPGSRECTQTVNVSDLVSAASATAEGGWVILTCVASPNGTDSYTITANTSVAAMVNLFSLATTNWSHLLTTTGTQTSGPAAGDSFIVEGQLTGAGTHNSYTVTVETTANINYGSVANTLVSPSIAVGQYGTLAFASAASINYKMEIAGPEVTYNGGLFTVGTSGTPIPASSTATLTLNSTTEGDTGLNTRNGGTLDVAGSSGGRNVVKTQLTATATGGVTTALTTATATGWLSGDSIYVAGTVATSSVGGYKGDAGTLSSNASGTTVTLSSAVVNTHTATQLSYTSTSTGKAYSMNMYADVVLLNRNVIIQGSGSTTNGYLYFQANSNAAMTWVEFSQISGPAANTGKRGIEADTGPLGTFTLTNFSIINSHGSTMILAPTNTNFGGTSGAYVLVQHGTFYNNGTTAVSNLYSLGLITTTLNPFWKLDDLTFILCNNGSFSSWAFSIHSIIGQASNISATGNAGGSSGAINISAGYDSASQSGAGMAVGNTLGPFTMYANVGYPYGSDGASNSSAVISGMYIWHENGRMQFQNLMAGTVIDPFYLIQTQFGVYNTPSGFLTLRNGVIGFDTLATADYPVTLDSTNGVDLFLDNMELCPVGLVGGVTFQSCAGTNVVSIAHDVNIGGYGPSNTHVYLRNTSLLNPLPYPSQAYEETFYSPNAWVMQDCSACTPVTHAAWVQGGMLSYDTTVTHTSGFSERVSPRVYTFSGYISSGAGSTSPGTTLTITTGNNTPYGATALVGMLLSTNGSGFVTGTYITAGTNQSFTVSQSQSVGSSSSPVQFQVSYNNGTGTPAIRAQSAPRDKGLFVAVKSGQSASVCVWTRPSSSSDASPPWFNSLGVTSYSYNSGTGLVTLTPTAYPALVLLGNTITVSGLNIPALNGSFVVTLLTGGVVGYIAPTGQSGTPSGGGTYSVKAVTYNGDNPRMLVRQNPGMNVSFDTVLSYTNSPTFSAGTWTQGCATTPTAPLDGAYEIVVDADQTFTSNSGGSVNVAEWSCSSTCNSGNGTEFWWYGTPSTFVSPATGGSTGFNGIVGGGGGYLLRRDLDPVSNDNTPVGLNKAA